MSWIQIPFLLVLLAVCAPFLGTYMARVYEGERVWLTPLAGRLERFIYRVAGIDPGQDMNVREYSLALLAFSLVCFAGLALLLIGQSHLPLNARHLPGLSAVLAFNVAASFVTNTNWQSYGGEQTMSMLSQMAGLTVQNFISPAVGLAVMAAVIRGFTRQKAEGIGNFWADTTRGILYLLLPLALGLALILSSQGVVQTFAEKAHAAWLDPSGQTSETQPLLLGPVASQVAIKQLGSNGGGYYNANAAHPFENPTPLTGFLELLAILLIPAAQCLMFGRMAKDARQGWVLFGAMALIFVPLVLAGTAQEAQGNPSFAPLGVEQGADDLQSGGNMEGKEMRFGALHSALWAGATAATSNGSTNASLDSFTPFGGLVPLVFMQFGEVVFGGVGSGLYGMLVFVIVTVFLAGLMVGRTPEYLGKKISVFEMKMASLAVLAPHLLVYVGAGLAVSLAAGKAGAFNPGAQGFSEILYAFTSAANNNGSAFAGLAANTPFYNISLGIVMLAGRYLMILPVLAMAGSLAAKNAAPPSSGSLPTTTPFFAVLLAFVIVLVGVLTFVPALTLGPLAEYFNLVQTGLPA